MVLCRFEVFINSIHKINIPTFDNKYNGNVNKLIMYQNFFLYNLHNHIINNTIKIKQLEINTVKQVACHSLKITWISFISSNLPVTNNPNVNKLNKVLMQNVNNILFKFLSIKI